MTCKTWHLTQESRHQTCDTRHTIFVSHFCLFLFVLVLVLLSAHVERFSVSRMGDLKKLLDWISCISFIHPFFFHLLFGFSALSHLNESRNVWKQWQGFYNKKTIIVWKIERKKFSGVFWGWKNYWYSMR